MYFVIFFSSFQIEKHITFLHRIFAFMSFRYLFLVLCLALAIASCNDSPSESPEASAFPGVEIVGEAQGTTYSIKYLGDDTFFKPQIDSILQGFDDDLSTWNPNSIITRMNAHNRRDTVFAFVDENKYFSVVFDLSRDIYERTNGAFDPSVYSLVQAWGFGLSHESNVSDEIVDSLLEDVGFTEFDIDMIEMYRDEYFYDHTNIWKGNPNVKLDFNAIAQGYSVDIVSDFLLEKNIQDFMVEIGGEVYCHGKNHTGQPWAIAIDQPLEDPAQRAIEAIVPIEAGAIATSGNYRNFYIKDGKKYSHTIDPRTGFPVQHNMLSATVIASSCAMADAYATAFMVMGLEESMDFINENWDLGLEIYLIYEEDGEIRTAITENLANMAIQP